MTGWFAAWSVLVIVTSWLFILGTTRLLASRQISEPARRGAPRSLVVFTLTLACASAVALLVVSVVLLRW